jgi:hypothetical protein
MRIVPITDNHRAAVGLLASFTVLFLAVLLFIHKLQLPDDVSHTIKEAFVLFEGALLFCLKSDGAGPDPKDPSFRDDAETAPSTPAKAE